jgi:methionyl-tRNA formyltransferase
MSDSRRIVFLGSDPLALPLLRYWLQRDHSADGELVGIVTQPDRAHGRGKKIQPAVLHEFADTHGIPCLQPERWSEETLELLRAWRPDVLIVLAYGHILRQPVLDLAPCGAWNFHASILPSLRGASPIETAVAEGDMETGMTLMRMVRKLDAGPMLGRKTVLIEDGDVGPLVREKLAQICVPLWQEYAPSIFGRKTIETPQDDSGVTYCRTLHKQDGWIDFQKEPLFWVRRERAFIAWPGISFGYRGDRIRVEGLSEEKVSASDANHPVGTVLDSCGALRIVCGSGVLSVARLQKPGGKMLPAADFLRGFSLPSGSLLESYSSQPLVSKQPFRYEV